MLTDAQKKFMISKAIDKINSLSKGKLLKSESMSDEREMRQMTLNVRLQDDLRPRVA